jgi:hypothetical protein
MYHAFEELGMIMYVTYYLSRSPPFGLIRPRYFDIVLALLFPSISFRQSLVLLQVTQAIIGAAHFQRSPNLLTEEIPDKLTCKGFN